MFPELPGKGLSEIAEGKDPIRIKMGSDLSKLTQANQTKHLNGGETGRLVVAVGAACSW